MDREKLLSFYFDTHERFSAVVDTIAKLQLSQADWLLDVGGRPGVIARLLAPRQTVTVDIPAVSHKPYVRATGNALPFVDGAFAVSFTSETLEHVPPAARETFLAELWRVSRGYVLVSGPFNTPGARQAEDAIRSLDFESPVAAEWLVEHVELGLPELGAAWQLYRSLGGEGVILPGISVARWLLMFGTYSLMEGLPGGDEAFSAFMPAYNTHFAATANGAPAYRHMLLFAKPGMQLPEMHGLKHPGELPNPPTLDDEIAALGMLIKNIGAALRRQSDLREGAGSPDVAYVEQLEKALQQQETRLQELENKLAIASENANPLKRWMKKKL